MKAIEGRARRVAKRAGFVAQKSRWRKDSIDNYGKFMLSDSTNQVVGGVRYDMSAEEVIAFCTERLPKA